MREKEIKVSVCLEEKERDPKKLNQSCFDGNEELTQQ